MCHTLLKDIFQIKEGGEGQSTQLMFSRKNTTDRKKGRAKKEECRVLLKQ
jgi:hypothetical protein